MATQRIDGLLFEKMIRNGLNNIILNEKHVNEMNVFPVPDGDTGTNMRMTLNSGIAKAASTPVLSDYIKALTSGMLLGARGNSGVILSQIFKGLCSELEKLDSMNTSDFLKALICGYKTAYAAVVNPVEGTVLTVAREGTEYVADLFEPDTSFETILEYYLQGMKRSLKRTPQLLPILLQAGVEDSGAMGFIVIVEGMYKYLCNEILDSNSTITEQKTDGVNIEAFGPDSKFEFGYCMEFLLRLMTAKINIDDFDFDQFTTQLKSLGESVVCVKDDTVIKVHIHVFEPAKVITFAQQYGEFLTFKLENMCLQHNEEIKESPKKIENVPLAVIAVGNGDGIKEVLSEFSYVAYLDGGDTMNTSTEEFVDAIKRIDADKILILPNNKNIVKSARQAVEILKCTNVEVVETSDAVQCFYALSMDMPSEPVSERIEAIKESIKEIKTVSMFTSIRDCSINGVQCKTGEFVCSVGSDLVASGFDFTDTLKQGLKTIDGIEDCEMCFAFTGKKFRYFDEVSSMFNSDFSDIEVQLINGGQEHRELILGLV